MGAVSGGQAASGAHGSSFGPGEPVVPASTGVGGQRVVGVEEAWGLGRRENGVGPHGGGEDQGGDQEGHCGP